MLDLQRLHEILESYMEDFSKIIWPDEKYKWQAIQHFQNHWNVNADDFPSMLSLSLDKTYNLLASAGKYPKATLIALAERETESVRGLFIELFDEHQDIVERILTFKDEFARLFSQYPDIGKNHFHDENTITTYLWLRYPDIYYIYKYTEARAISNTIAKDLIIKKGAYADNIRNSLQLYDALTDALRKETTLVSMFRSQLNEDYYPDPELRTLAIDVGFYITNTYTKQLDHPEAWGPKNYSPGITVSQWVALLQNPKIFDSNSLAIIKRFTDFGEPASCTQLSQKYGESVNFYNRGVSALGKRIAKETNCPLSEESDSRYWPVAFVGKRTSDGVEGSFTSKIREELAEALKQVDLSHIPLYAQSNGTIESNRQYWWLNANPKHWSFASIPLRSEESYSLVNERGNKRRIYQNFLDAKVGDIVIGYETSPTRQIVALAQITGEQDGERLYFEKIEQLQEPISFADFSTISELKDMEFLINPQGSLFQVTESEYQQLMDIIREGNPPFDDLQVYNTYTKDDFLHEVYMAEPVYERLVGLLKRKKNIILQGPPGVGKTFAANRLAYSIMGVQDKRRVEIIQFHQNYSYEDFILGYKPVDETFELHKGIFYQFCLRAANEPEKEFFFIIDEINRGNLSKIFGELLMLIETDYRDLTISLAYDNRPFFIPSNLYLIGMMNTADRSLAMIDYALRRRFSFFEMRPAFDSKGFRVYQEKLDDEIFDQLMTIIKELNRAIEADGSLGSGFAIGHSYFCNLDKLGTEELYSIVDYEILPLLREYWFDNDSLYQTWESQLMGVFQ